MAMKEKQQMVRVPGSVWDLMVSTGLESGRSGAEVARDWMYAGARSEGVELPKAEDRKERKRKKLLAELEKLG